VKIQNRSIMTAAIAAACAFGASDSQPEALRRVHEATVVFDEIMNAKDAGIPQNLLDKSHCVIIVPGMKHAGFIVGAKYGKGEVMCRKEGGGWRGPATVRVEGGSFGLQIGAGETDLILLVMNAHAKDKLLSSEFKLGGEAGVMAGPIGRTVQAETDATMHAEMLGYSRSRGVFAGVAVEGSTIRQDLDDNELIYGQRATNKDILEGPATLSPQSSGWELARTLTRYSTWERH
jgi:lipid-binding SYLF domain-containing protein